MPVFEKNRELLDAFRRGERDALGTVYRAYVKSLSGFLARGFSFKSQGRLLRFSGYTEPFDLDDALQETFSRAFSETGRMGYDGIRPYKNYLFAIARNYMINSFRCREIATDISCEKLAQDEMRQPTPDPSDELIRTELNEIYRKFVAQLTDAERGVIEYRFQRGLPRRDVCERLDLTPMKLRGLETKLKARFTQLLIDTGYHESSSTDARGPMSAPEPDGESLPRFGFAALWSGSTS